MLPAVYAEVMAVTPANLDRIAPHTGNRCYGVIPWNRGICGGRGIGLKEHGFS